MNLVETPRFQGNKLSGVIDDLFGFEPVAQRVASAIFDQTGEECFVVGLEGEWGAGKSTLLAILENELVARAASTLRFTPWLIGSKEALLTELLSGLENEIAKQEGVDGDATRSTKIGAKAALERFRSYSGIVATAGRIAGLAGIAGVPIAGIVAEAAEKAATVLKEGKGETPITALKERSNEALKGLARRITVLIDDLDRLEPQEAVEVLRLVQSVADFPNVTYVLCYDRPRLAESIRTVTNVSDGSAYLEKIVQVVVPVPLPQSVALRGMFTSRLKELTGQEDIDERVASIILDHIGPRLRTPRTVVRTLDALKLIWPGLREQVNLADLVWLQFIRAEDQALYRWIEEYCAEAEHAPATLDGLRPLRRRLGQSLNALLNRPSHGHVYWDELREFLPMVATDSDLDNGEALFIKNSGQSTFPFLLNRLSSLDHARLYFGLMRPPGAMTDNEMRTLLKESRDAGRVAQSLLELANASSRGGVNKLVIVLEQLTPAIPRMEEVEIAGFVAGLLQVVDDLRPVGSQDITIFRQTLGRVLSRMSEVLSPDVWGRIVISALPAANAHNFLISEVTVGDDKAAIAWAGTGLSAVHEHLSGIFESSPPARLIDSPMLGKVMDIWKSIDGEGFADFTDKIFHNETLLISLIACLYNRIASASGNLGVLAPHVFKANLEALWSHDTIVRRIEGIIASSDPSGLDSNLFKALEILKDPTG